MPRSASKGTNLQLSISALFTTIANVENINGPDGEVLTFENPSLDGGVGVPNIPTGYVNGGTAGGSLWFDPVAATLQALTDLMLAPVVSLWKNIYSDAGATEWPYSGTLKKCTPSASVGDGLKADYEVQLDGIVAYPT